MQKCNWRVSLFVKHLNRKKLGKRHIKGYKKVEKIKKIMLDYLETISYNIIRG